MRPATSSNTTTNTTSTNNIVTSAIWTTISVVLLVHTTVTSPFELIRIVSSMEQVGKHAVGDILAEIQMAPRVDLQIQWYKIVHDPLKVPDRNGTSIESDHHYQVPIVGDSWCTVSYSNWVESKHNHVTSTLACHHLPSENNLRLILSLTTLDGRLQYQRQISALSVPGDSTDVAPLDWLAPISFHQNRSYSVHDGEPLAVNFTVETRSNDTIQSVVVGWSSDESDYAYEDQINFENRNYFHEPNGTNYTFYTVATPNGTFRHTVFVAIPVTSSKHRGEFWVKLIRSDEIKDSVAFFFTVNVIQKEISKHREESDFKMSVHSCSDLSRGTVSKHGNTFNFRLGVPDCIYCRAVGIPAPRTELYRADGFLLGTEESHSVYWYRDSYASSVSVFVIRSPSEEYNGEYVCSVNTPRSEESKHRKDRIKFKINVQ